MSKVKKLTNSDMNRIVKKVISEQTNPIYKPTWTGPGQRGPGPAGLDSVTKSYTVNMDGSLFKNGEDKIDTNSSQFKKGIDAIQTAISKSILSNGKTSIKIIGGASAVGNSTGYDNKALAQRRATNFYNIVKDKFPNVDFSMGQPVVGKSTVKNSNEANAEQFVKLVVSGSKTDLSTRQAIDHTAVNLNIGPNKQKKKENISVEKKWIVCFEISDSIYQKIKDKKNILSAKQKN